MTRATIVTALTVSILICVILASGCSGTPTAPALAPNVGDKYLVHGIVDLDGKAVPGAEIDAISHNGTYHFTNVTDDNGAYVLYLPKDVLFNISAANKGLKHTIWPVSAGGDYNKFNISLTATPKSYIAGTGYSVGGYIGYNNSQPLTGFTFELKNATYNTTLTAVLKSDWSYSVEVEPGVTYLIEKYMPGVNFNYRNCRTSGPINVTVGQNETALVDYVVVLP